MSTVDVVILVFARLAACAIDDRDRWITLQRWWAAWSKAPPPPPLQALISSVAAGCGLHLYIPN